MAINSVCLYCKLIKPLKLISFSSRALTSALRDASEVNLGEVSNLETTDGLNEGALGSIGGRSFLIRGWITGSFSS